MLYALSILRIILVPATNKNHKTMTANGKKPRKCFFASRTKYNFMGKSTFRRFGLLPKSICRVHTSTLSQPYSSVLGKRTGHIFPQMVLLVSCSSTVADITYWNCSNAFRQKRKKQLFRHCLNVKFLEKAQRTKHFNYHKHFRNGFPSFFNVSFCRLFAVVLFC